MLKIFHHSPTILVAATALALGATACSSDDSAAAGRGGAGGSGGGGPVSFKTDIIGVNLDGGGVGGIFRRSCALSTSCHYDPMVPKGQLWLGPKSGEPDPSTADLGKMHDQLLKVATVINMPRVTPGDLNNSFLWHKLKHDQNMLMGCTGMGLPAASAAVGKCGDYMPQDSPALDAMDPKDMNTISAWITGGALNN